MSSEKLIQDIKEFLGQKDAIVLPVRMKKQVNSFSCGAAALSIVFSYYGQKVSIREMAHVCETNPQDGTKFRKLAEVARDSGFAVDVLKNSKASTVRAYINEGIPIIPCWQMTPLVGDTHYSVLIGYDKDHFIFAEPARWYAYYTKIPIRRFVKIWKDLESGTWGDGLAIYLSR
jgi:ABC-type bacteriocin/lantibiotic exporter with double-glycine peptidase domain